MIDTIKSLNQRNPGTGSGGKAHIIRKLKEEKADLKTQLDVMTDHLQTKEAGADPAGGMAGGALLRDYCLFLSTQDPGLTVGVDYDIRLSLQAAKDYWVENGGEAADLD
jgi:hypothetical protein